MTCTTTTTTKKTPKSVCINPEMCLYTPQRRQGQQNKEKSSKKNQNFWPIKLSLGGKWNYLGVWMRWGWWEGTWGQHRDKLIHPIPQPRNSLGIWGRNLLGFSSDSPIFHLCCSLIIHPSSSSWLGVGCHQKLIYSAFFFTWITLWILDILLKIWFLGFLSTQPNQLKSKSKSILPLWYFCAKHFWLFGEDKTQRNFSLQLKKKHLEPFTHTKLILWIFQDFLFCFVFWPGNFPKSKTKRGKVGFSSSRLGFFQDLSAGFPPVLPSPRG